MQSSPISEAGWEGWVFDEGYLIDQEGNRYHPLMVKASFFYCQLQKVKSLAYWRPDNLNIDAWHPDNRWVDENTNFPILPDVVVSDSEDRSIHALLD